MSSRWQPQKMAWWYYALMDEIIRDPVVKPKTLAAHFNVSVVTIQMVTSSDAFKALLTERQKNNSAYLDAAIRQQAAQNAIKGMRLQERIMEAKQTQLPMAELTTMVDKTLSRLGYGEKSSGLTIHAPGGTTNVVVPVSLNDLEAARAALRQSEMAKVLSGNSQRRDSDLVLVSNRR